MAFALPLPKYPRALPAALLTALLASIPAAPASAQSAAAPNASAAAAAKRGQPIEMANPSFVSDAAGELTGWHKIEHASGNSYTFTADKKAPLSKPSSLRIERHGVEAYGLLEQRVPTLPAWEGRTVRLSGSLKSAKATEGGGALILQARTAGSVILAHDHMNDTRVRGDQGWTKVSVQVKLPPQTGQLLVGVILEGPGTLWADDLSLELLD